jgi:ribosome maturation factor RimP
LGAAKAATLPRPAGAATSSVGRLNWREAIEQTVTGLGYELVDVERSARGLLRVFIDRVPGKTYPSGDGEFITVDDCEQVTRQLQYALEVDGVAYERLEVSSPGLDRPLRREADYQRFAGQEISLTLKAPFQGRKVWKGRLVAGEGGGWVLQFNDGKAEQVLAFAFDEVRDAHLVPVLDFKGRRGQKTAPAPQGDDGGSER